MVTAAFCCVFLCSDHNASRSNRRARVIDCDCASRGGGPAARTWDPRFTPRPRHRAAAVNTATDDSRRPPKKQHYFYCGVREVVVGGWVGRGGVQWQVLLTLSSWRAIMKGSCWVKHSTQVLSPTIRQELFVCVSTSGFRSIINYADISKRWDLTVCLNYYNWL